MKNIARKAFLCLIVLTLFVFSCMAASAEADIENIMPGDGCSQNGSVKVTAEQGKAIITLKPDSRYLAAAVSLTARDGSVMELRRESANVYSCDLPAAECTLDVSFRLARVILSKSELAMKSGDTFTVTASLTCSDGEINTRDNIIDRGVVFASSDPSVVSVDPETGELTAHKMGYARINVTAVAGNGVGDFFYVIVDGDKSPVVGTIQLTVSFDEKHLVENKVIGHSFLVFTNTSGKPITIGTSGFYQCYVPTAKYYNAVDSYDGTGYDPVTFYYATNGEFACEDNLEARRAYRNLSFFTKYKRGILKTYTIRPNDIATFGAVGDDLGIEDGDFEELLERYGKTFDLEKIKVELLSGRIDAEEYLYRLEDLLNEVLYDCSTGFNPFNGRTVDGGFCMNEELDAVILERDYTNSAACKTKITEVQLMAMLDFAQYDNYFTMLAHNCTACASAAWNLVTAAKPQYHFLRNAGGVTSAASAPIFLRNNILSRAPLLAGDNEIEFFNGIEVIKPAKYVTTTGCEHQFTNGKCTECGAIDPEWTGPKACPSEAFPDAPEKGNWAHEGIDYCIANEYMNGTGNGLFSPDGDVTRAQLVTIIYRIEGEPETEFKGTFADVQDGLWYSKAIEWAAANGIVNGVGEGKFDPTGVITREQIATIFFRYAKAEEGEGSIEQFPDASDAHEFAVPALGWATRKGIINGVSAEGVTYLKPLANASRAQIASIIMRYLEGEYKCGE